MLDKNTYINEPSSDIRPLLAGGLGAWTLKLRKNDLCFFAGESFLALLNLTEDCLSLSFSSFCQNFILADEREPFRLSIEKAFKSEASFSFEHFFNINGKISKFHSFGACVCEKGELFISAYSQRFKPEVETQASHFFNNQSALQQENNGSACAFRGADGDDSLATLKQLFNDLPLACQFYDENHQIIDCNQMTLNLFALSGKQSLLDNFYIFSPSKQACGGSSKDLSKEFFTKAFENGYAKFNWLHTRFDGSTFPCEVTLVRTKIAGKYVLVSYILDFTEVNEAKARADNERNLLKHILNSSPICFFVYVGGTIRFITNFTKNFTGLVEGDSAQKAFIENNLLNELDEELKDKNFINWRHVDVYSKSGKLYSMLLNAFQCDYYGEPGTMLWLMDVTDMKNRASELKDACDAAEESAKAKSEFLANMSHEIRTPMNAILGLIHLVMQTDITAAQEEYLQKTQSAAKTLLRIINDILDFSKIEAGKLEMENEVFYLDDVIQQVVDVISPKANEKNLELLLRVAPNVPAKLLGDQVRLSQVLSNLLSNAVKFTEHGEVTLAVDILKEENNKVSLEFKVSDSGIGMKEDQNRNIFRAFSQADLSTTRRFGGTGLGLTISRHLVELMGGKIWCESILGKGSTFSFTANFGATDSSHTYISKRKDFTGLTALTVDDNVVALEITSEFLRSLGFSVNSANSGSKALEIIQERYKSGGRFDLVLMDWKMPGMDGIETSSLIKKIMPSEEMPVVLMATAYNRDEVLTQAKKNGIANVMAKPLSPSTILNTLLELFGRGLPEKATKLEKTYEMVAINEYKGSRILLAEDNEINQLVASRILKNVGFLVDIAVNGRQAVEMASKGIYDLILMDIQMPEMDGIEATRRIRKIKELKNLPIVAMTAHAMSGDREQSLKAGMNDHINKPINLQELFSTLAHWIKIPKRD